MCHLAPKNVNNLMLTSTNNNITATWDPPDGNYVYFLVEIFSPMVEENNLKNDTTTIKTYTFLSLQTAALYNVTVTAYVKSDMNPSKSVSGTIFTRKCKKSSNLNFIAYSVIPIVLHFPFAG